MVSDASSEFSNVLLLPSLIVLIGDNYPDDSQNDYVPSLPEFLKFFKDMISRIREDIKPERGRIQIPRCYACMQKHADFFFRDMSDETYNNTGELKGPDPPCKLRTCEVHTHNLRMLQVIRILMLNYFNITLAYYVIKWCLFPGSVAVGGVLHVIIVLTLPLVFQ